MLLIPAIDLKNGQCVRLRQGRMDDSTVFSANPLAVAQKWAACGAKRLHIVDLDGAFAGKPVNAEIITEICATLPNLDIQIGGGIRDKDTIRSYLDTGVNYLIIGTKAINTPNFIGDICAEFHGHIIIGLDAKDGKVAIDGWSKLSRHDVIDTAKRLEQDGVDAIIYTDISRDGMMQGVNVDATRKLANAINIPVIASGGVTDYSDIEALCACEEDGVNGIIVGRALYEGTINLAKGQALVDKLSPAYNYTRSGD